MGLFKDCGCGCKGKKQEQKFKISLMSALVFFIVANPDTFRLMRRLFGSWVSGPNGCPTTAGVILHTIVFMLIVWGMMTIKTQETYAPYEPDVTSAHISSEPDRPEMVTHRMMDMPSPKPGMSEKTYPTKDSGRILKPMDMNSDADTPCSCTDGRKVIIRG